MAFLNNKKFLEIKQAGKDGNEKAKMILQAMRKGSTQADLDRLVDDYYNLNNDEDDIESFNWGDDDDDEVELNQDTQEVVEDNTPMQQPQVKEPTIPQELKPQIVQDLSEVLDKDTDGLFDENEIKDITFGDFLKTKKRDANRSKKNAEYFKAYDMNGRQKYMQGKIDGYKKKFNNKLRDIDRKYNDTNKSLDFYSMKANDMLDDDIEMDMTKSMQAYDDFTNSEPIMSAFGRYYDEQDTNDIIFALKELMRRYGKKNVINALNTLKSDNESYKKYLDNQIDTEIGRYTKSIENLLK
jgi:hypothetical protein